MVKKRSVSPQGPKEEAALLDPRFKTGGHS